MTRRLHILGSRRNGLNRRRVGSNLSANAAVLHDLTEALGSSSGQALAEQQGTDKFETFGLETFAGTAVGAPLLAGCAAWLECRLLPEPPIQQTYDLFLGEVVAAHADARVFSNGRWHFDGHDALRTIHHVAGGHFLVDGAAVDARPLAALRAG